MEQLFDIFSYEFMWRAFVVATILAIILPLIGLPMIIKRLSMMGDTLSHASLAGVATGLCFGFNPILGAIVACVLAGLSVEVIRNRLQAYQEISTVVILAASIGLAGIFSSFGTGGNVITSYLFGSIVTISDLEFYLILAVAVLVIAIYALIYKQLYLSIFDAKNAEIMQINIKFLNFLYSFLTAVTVSISAKTIGSLIVSSLLVIPVIAAMQLVKTYRATLVLSVLFSLFYSYTGLILSYYFDLKPGSVIVLLAVVVLVLIVLFRKKRLIS